jgi:hypothetical protein
MILAFGGKDHPLAHQISKHAHVLMPFAHAQFVHADTTHVAEIRLGISCAHLPEEHPPQARVSLPHQFSHLAHGHLAHEQQREGFKLLGEVHAQTLPRRTHAKHMTALFALAAWQPAGDFTAVLEDVEMSPRQDFSVVVAGGRGRVFGTAHQLPHPRRLSYLQKDRAAFLVKSALDHFPLQSQSQQLMKQFLRCHVPRLPTGSTENSGEPIANFQVTVLQVDN